MNKDDFLSNHNIAVFALYKLGGVTKKIHTEHIAWEAYNLSKERFSWNLPEFRKLGFPDKTTVRYALESAKKLKLVNGRAGKDKGGSTSEGWQLTPGGVEWMLKNSKKMAGFLQFINFVPWSRMQKNTLARCGQEKRTQGLPAWDVSFVNCELTNFRNSSMC